MKIISGLRTYAEQDALYAQGRAKTGPKVTNARGGYSNHNFGIAFDVGVFEGNRYLPDSAKYKAVGALGTDFQPRPGAVDSGGQNASTTRPRILPAFRSSRIAVTSLAGRVLTGVALSFFLFASATTSFSSCRLPT